MSPVFSANGRHHQQQFMLYMPYVFWSNFNVANSVLGYGIKNSRASRDCWKGSVALYDFGLSQFRGVMLVRYLHPH